MLSQFPLLCILIPHFCSPFIPHLIHPLCHFSLSCCCCCCKPAQKMQKFSIFFNFLTNTLKDCCCVRARIFWDAQNLHSCEWKIFYQFPKNKCILRPPTKKLSGNSRCFLMSRHFKNTFLCLFFDVYRMLCIARIEMQFLCIKIEEKMQVFFGENARWIFYSKWLQIVEIWRGKLTYEI